MNSVALWSSKEREELFQATSTKRGIPAALIEKDFWVCWILDKIFTNEDLSKGILFKGGTTLSKVFGVIERFSEDIDLIIDWEELGTEPLIHDRTKSGQRKFVKRLRNKAKTYIEESFLTQLSDLVDPTCKVKIVEGTPLSMTIRYPPTIKADSYNPSEILLETGPIAETEPSDEFKITSYAAEMFPDQFTQRHVSVRSILAERTFWEKATILHIEAQRPNDKPVPLRYSRHYYDMMSLAISDVKDRALSNIDLLEKVADFKNSCFPSGWADYDTARVGSLKLTPPEHNIRSLRRDYDQMQDMFFGDAPTFDEILKVIEQLETEINKLPK